MYTSTFPNARAGSAGDVDARPRRSRQGIVLVAP